jgi:hypothetical protein
VQILPGIAALLWAHCIVQLFNALVLAKVLVRRLHCGAQGLR